MYRWTDATPINGYTTLLNPTISTDKLDADGNLVVDTSEVITKTPGSVTVSPEVLVALVA